MQASMVIRLLFLITVVIFAEALHTSQEMHQMNEEIIHQKKEKKLNKQTLKSLFFINGSFRIRMAFNTTAVIAQSSDQTRPFVRPQSGSPTQVFIIQPTGQFHTIRSNTTGRYWTCQDQPGVISHISLESYREGAVNQKFAIEIISTALQTILIHCAQKPDKYIGALSGEPRVLRLLPMIAELYRFTLWQI